MNKKVDFLTVDKIACNIIKEEANSCTNIFEIRKLLDISFKFNEYVELYQKGIDFDIPKDKIIDVFFESSESIRLIILEVCGFDLDDNIEK